MADWAGNDTGPANDVNSSPGADVGSSSASGSSSGSSSDFWSNPANTPAGREAAAMANTGLSNKYTSSSDPGRYAATATYDKSGQISGYAANPSAGVGGAAGEQARAIASAQASSQATPSNIALMEASLPGANVYNQMANAINAARQPGATGASVQASVNYYNNPTDITGRAGYYISQPGDSGTQRLIDQGYSPMYALAQQLLSAYRTPGTTDERFYLNELSKVNHNYVEASSGYHHWGMKTNLPVAANPFEYTGDLALALEKGIGGKSGAQITTPTNLSVLSLPNGLSLQDAAWNLAKGEKYQVDFSQPISVIDKAATLGTMGVYGKLSSYSSTLGIISLQGQQDIAMRASKGAEWVVHPEMLARNPAQNMRALGYGIEYQSKPASERLVGGKVVAATTQVSADRVGITPTSPAGVEIAMAEGALPRPFVSGGKGAVVEPTLLEKTVGYSQPVLRMTLASTPFVGLLLAMGSDVSFAIASGKKENLPFYDVIKTISTPYSQPEGSVTTSEYESNLAKYNSALSSYNVEKGVYEKLTTPTPEEYSKLTTSYEGLQSEQSKLETQKQNIVNPPTAFDTIGNVYEGLNKGLAPYTTDILGIGRTLEATPDIDLKRYGGDTVPGGYSDIINFSKGFVSSTYQHPIDIALSYGGGKLLTVGEGVAKYGVARLAMSNTPVVGFVGRAASTPLASDVVTLVKYGVGVYVIKESAENIIDQPTYTEKGEASGRTVLQFAGFGAGMLKSAPTALPETPNRYSLALQRIDTITRVEPTNAFAGRNLAGVRVDTPLETTRSYVSMQLNRLTMPAEESAIYRNNWDIARAVKYIEPAKLTEPNLGDLARVPPEHVQPLLNTIADVPFTGQGSGFVQAQRSTLPTGDRLGMSKDLDGFAEGFLDRLAQEPGATRQTVATPMGGNKDTVFINRQPVAADIHPYPPDYPGAPRTISPDSRIALTSDSKVADVHDVGWGTRLLGQPLRPQPTSLAQIRNPVTEGQAGDIIGYEKENIQALRVLEATNRDIQTLSGENTRGYRLEKDVYRSKTVPEELIAVERARNTPQSRVMEPMFQKADAALADNMRRSITFERNAGSAPETRTIAEIYNQGLADVQAGRVPYQMEGVAGADDIFTLKPGTAQKYGIFNEEQRFKIEIIKDAVEPREAPTIETVGKYSGPEYVERVLARQKMYEALPENSRTSTQGGITRIIVPENNPTMSISKIPIESKGYIQKLTPSNFMYVVPSISGARSSVGSVSPSPTMGKSTSSPLPTKSTSPGLVDYPSIGSPPPSSPTSISPSPSTPPSLPSSPSPIPPYLLPPSSPRPPSYIPSPSPSPPPPSTPPSKTPPEKPSPPPPIVPRPPGIPWLPSGGGGGGGGARNPRGPRHIEIFSYAPKNLKGLYGMPKGRTPAIKKRK